MVYGIVWGCMVVYGAVRWCVVVYGGLRLPPPLLYTNALAAATRVDGKDFVSDASGMWCMVVYVDVRWCVVVYGGVWWCMLMCGGVR